MRERRIGWALAAAVLALLVTASAACGKAQAEDGIATAGGNTAEVAASEAPATPDVQKFAQCMRDNGIDLPDPEPGSEGRVRIGGMNPGNREAFMKAMEACRHLAPNGGQRPQLDAAQIEQLRVLAQCMRDNGVDVPDPDPNGGPIFGGGAAGQPPVDRNSPTFQKALEACQDKLPQFRIRTSP